MKAVKIIAVSLACLLLCGCDLWFDGYYHSMEPNRGRQNETNRDSTEVSTYAEIRNALLEMTSEGVQKRVFYVSGMEEEQMRSYFYIASNYVVENDPVGAYAVERIDFDIGTNAAKAAVSVEITYIHGRSEILRIKKSSSKEQTESYITTALKKCEAGVVIHTEDYKTLDVVQFVQDYVNEHPESCMEMPQVSAVVYPERGSRRIIEVSFVYQTSRDTLKEMQNAVEPIFSSAKLYVSEDTEKWNKLMLLYSFLMERFEYTVETSITPSYSLLIHGVGDSKTFAVVYAAMCRNAGVTCEVVSGTKEGEPYYWNAIQEEGTYHHLDLLECVQAGGFTTHIAEEMPGYVWDYSAFEGERQIVN